MEQDVEPISLMRKWKSLLLLSTGTVCALGIWFSATSINEALEERWSLSTTQFAWLTMAVQLGFVVGAISSAMLNLPDRLPSPLLFFMGSVAGATANASLAIDSIGFLSALGLRFVTGLSCAAIYPIGMKIMATWTRRDRGLGLGLLVGAVVIGSASPHLLRSSSADISPNALLIVTSLLALLGGLTTLLFVEMGPYRTKAAKFQWSQISHAFRRRPLFLANLGYLGHMWELYAMWTWLPIFVGESLRASSHAAKNDTSIVSGTASLIAFFAIAAGGLGSLLFGLLADRWGRTATASLSLAASGCCALLIGFAYGGPVWLLVAISIAWGFFVVADSAQFSSAVSELAAKEYVGTQLTTQTAFGFLLTLSTIQLVPQIKAWIGWQWAFLPLCLGPVVGLIAMWQLRCCEESEALAGGRR